MQEKTFLAVKPAAYARGDAPGIIKMLSEGLPDAKCIAMKIYKPSKELATKHYEAHIEKPFFPDLLASFTSGPIVGMVWEGENIVARARELMGATNPEKAAEGTIRKVYAKSMEDNAIHGSDTDLGSAEREVSIHFPEEDFQVIKDPASRLLSLH
jgi:nucleoside-diphosphate kinase